MKPKQTLKDYWRDLCADLNEDDGISPDELKKQETRRSKTERGADRSTRRLCAHTMRAVHLSLLADCHDTELQALEVLSVEPNPDAKRLLVTLSPSTTCTTDLNTLVAKVHAVAHLLRHAVAQGMSRKRTPQLTFVIEPKDGVSEIDKEAEDED